MDKVDKEFNGNMKSYSELFQVVLLGQMYERNINCIFPAQGLCLISIFTIIIQSYEILFWSNSCKSNCCPSVISTQVLG